LPATIYDIAKEANVSIATVSRVFNNSTKVSPKTRENVMRVARSMGYYPQAYAQGLAKKKKNNIVAIAPVMSNYFFMEVLGGIQDKLAEYEFDLNIINVTSNRVLIEQVEYVLKQRMAEGYLFISVHLSNEEWQELKKYNMPMSLVDEYHIDFNSVSVDSVEGAFTATNYLIKKGYHRISLLGARETSKPIKERKQGYMRALQDAGISVDENLIVASKTDYRDGFTEKGGYEAMKTLLENEPTVEACLCASDIQAVGAIKAMKDAGRYVPLISFDDIALAEYVELSTMHQPMYDMGYLATEKLIGQMTNEKSMVSHTVFSPQLVIRSSSEAGTFQPLADYGNYEKAETGKPANTSKSKTQVNSK